MIRLQGSHAFAAPQAAVWDAVRDPNVLAQVLPGCERLEAIGENEYEGEINIRVGPVQGKFQGKVTLTHIDAPNGYHIDIQGQGQPGFVQGNGELKLESSDGKTVLNYSGEAQVSGRIAGVGQRLMDSSARSIVRQGLESLDNLIQLQITGAAETVSAQAAAATKPVSLTTTQVATEVAKDVAKEMIADLAQPEQQSTLRSYAIITVGMLAVLWMYTLLFGKEKRLGD